MSINIKPTLLTKDKAGAPLALLLDDLIGF